jgi:hypothetical protein
MSTVITSRPRMVLADQELRLIQVHRRLDPQMQQAVFALADWRAREDEQTRAPRASGRRLIERLRAGHRCPKATEPGFVQLPSTGHREWRCEACGAIVDLVHWGKSTVER